MHAPIEAIRMCRNTGRNFAEVFRRQYVLTRDKDLCPEEWTLRTHAGWHLCHCPDLPVVEIKDAAGNCAGWLLGIAIPPAGGLLSDDPTLPSAPCDPGFWNDTEEMIAGLAGRYLVMVWNGEKGRIYTDPVCDLALVFDPETQMAASSVFMCLNRELEENPRVSFRGPIKGQHNFALQQTADRAVRRAMANHYLCLRTFGMVRFAPRDTASFEGSPETLHDACTAMNARLGQIMEVLLTRFEACVPVTGGQDSRMLLASCLPYLDEAKAFYTHHSGNKNSGFDCLIAQEIGQLLGIDVQIVDVAKGALRDQLSGRAARRLYWTLLIATGYQLAGGSPGDKLASTQAPAGDLIIRGNVMELLRANQWPAGEFTNFSLNQGLAKLRVAPRITAEAEAEWGPDYLAWRETLPEAARPRTYDFAFCELLLPNTMGGWLIGQRSHFVMNAFNDRSLIETAISLPPKMRRRGRVNATMMSLAPPELAQVTAMNEARKSQQWHEAYDKQFQPFSF